MSVAFGEIKESTGPEDVPRLVRAAGEQAVRAYREFLDDPVRTASTRKLYRLRAGQILPLGRIAWSDPGYDRRRFFGMRLTSNPNTRYRLSLLRLNLSLN